MNIDQIQETIRAIIIEKKKRIIFWYDDGVVNGGWWVTLFITIYQTPFINRGEIMNLSCWQDLKQMWLFKHYGQNGRHCLRNVK